MKRFIYTIIVAFVLTTTLSSCQQSTVKKQSEETQSKGGELFCMVDNEEEGRRIAELYGITMVEYTYKVAIFTTDEDISEVISRGKENGWPTLEVNYVVNVD